MDMFCSRVYKPNRILYYIYPTEEQKCDYFQGIMPECFAPYDGAFGTYDHPGMFIKIDGDKKTEVLGMEFRPNDERVSYPENMESVMLPGGFMVLARFAELEQMLNYGLFDGISLVKKYMEATNHHDSLIIPKENPGLIQVFTLYNQAKIFIEAEQCEDSDFFSMVEPETENEKKLFNAAYRDWITGHYNWNYILPLIVGYGLNGIQDFAFAHFDVKDFKAINVVYGHDAANELLRQIVGQLNKMDWIYYSARCDNDNFCMMIKDMPEDEMRQKLFDFFEEISILPDDPKYRVYYRCGVVPMRHALLFCDTVADAGKEMQRLGDKKNETEVLFYSDSAHDVLAWSTRTKVYLDTAIQQDEFLVYLQPKYDIKTEKLYGAEALIRWNYRGKEMLNPANFIPIFEMGGLISKLDDFVLKKVCTYLKKWENEGRILYPISVNLSRKSLAKANLVEHLTKIVDSYEVEHKWIEFELTESAAYENQDYMLQVMQGLRKAGFKISMDDFGTGYSSLSLLSSMPMDTIKIDKSFVDKIALLHGENKECAVLKHIVSMVKELKLTCLAEGVEEKEQLDILSGIGCELVQGYYYSKPLPVEEYEKRL